MVGGKHRKKGERNEKEGGKKGKRKEGKTDSFTPSIKMLDFSQHPHGLLC